MGKLLDAFMPKLWPWIALAVAAVLAWQTLRIAGLQVEIAQLHTSAAKKAQQQAELGQAAIEKKATALLQHAADTQDGVYEYTQRLKILEAGRAADAGRIAGLQHDLRVTSTGHAQAASDLTACRDLADRHQELGELAARSAGVIGRSIDLVKQRDAEVTLLKAQVLTERGLVERLQVD